VAALVNIDMETVGKWAERRRISYTTYADLAQKPEVYDLVQREVERVNRDLPAATRIRKYLLLHKELDPDDEEITRTRKLRRGVIGKKYAPIIEALYEDQPLVAVTAEVTYQDGRKAVTETKLAIRTVDAGAPGSGSGGPDRPGAGAGGRSA
jgi:long-chain acyl-CoA synthetase